MLESGRRIPAVFGRGWRFPGFGPPPSTPWSFNSGTVTSPLGMSFHSLIKV